MRQVIYSRNGVNITATPVEHYTTGGPSALRVDWNGLSFVYSGGRTTPYARTRILHEQHSSCGHPAHLPGQFFNDETRPWSVCVGLCALQVALCSAERAITILHSPGLFMGWRVQKDEDAAVHCRRHPPHAHAQRAG